MTETRKRLVIEDERALFTNFAGEEQKYNRKGNRNFKVTLNDQLAEELTAEGWNVKWLNSREDEDPQAIMEIVVNYGGRPPRVVMITSRGKTALTEETVDVLDVADIEKVDVIANPYHWNVSGAQGVKAYAESLFVTVRENELDLKYADLDEV